MKAAMLTVPPCIVFVVVDDQDLAHAPGVWHQEGCTGRALARFLLEPAKYRAVPILTYLTFSEFFTTY